MIRTLIGYLWVLSLDARTCHVIMQTALKKKWSQRCLRFIWKWSSVVLCVITNIQSHDGQYLDWRESLTLTTVDVPQIAEGCMRRGTSHVSIWTISRTLARSINGRKQRKKGENWCIAHGDHNFDITWYWPIRTNIGSSFTDVHENEGLNMDILRKGSTIITNSYWMGKHMQVEIVSLNFG